MDKFEDMRTEEGRERSCDGADITADPIGKGLCIRVVPSSGPADLSHQGLERRVISIAKGAEKIRLGFMRGRGGVTEVVVVSCSDSPVHSHVARGEVKLEIVRSWWVVGLP